SSAVHGNGEGAGSMECEVHVGRRPVGYCKKCGRFGCEKCLVRVIVGGDIGRRSRNTEILVCHDCLNKFRPDLILSTLDWGRVGKKKRAARIRRSRKQARKLLVVAVAVASTSLAIAAAVMFRPLTNVSRHFDSAEEVATKSLEALAAGNVNKFLSCVDVRAFMCRMDSTGLMRRDYEQAGRKQRNELEASHCEFLAKDFFVTHNLRRKFKVVRQDVREDSASFVISPWIQFGNKLYKRILLERKRGVWKISGLASPDY
ncbi:MAG: hypothetical protein JSV16_02830, partial [Candidatus Hydrogenedentota bacterium]